jgi:hypothetical protein
VTRRIVEAPEQRGAWARVAIALARRGALGELPACADVRGLSWDRKLWVVACRERGREWSTTGKERCPFCGREAV